MHVNRMSAAKMLLVMGMVIVMSGCGSDGTNGTVVINGTNGAGQVVTLQQVGRTASQGFGVSAAEIVAFDSAGKHVFAVNAQSGKLDVFTASNISAPVLQQSIDLRALLVANGKAASTAVIGAANSVSIHGNLAALRWKPVPRPMPVG